MIPAANGINCEAYVKQITMSQKRRDKLALTQIQSAYANQWHYVASRIHDVVQSTFNKYSTTSKRQRLYMNSDIYAIDEMPLNNFSKLDEHLENKLDQCYDFAASGTFEKHYEEYYNYEKERGANYGPETLDGNSRYQYVATRVGFLPAGSLVLDYGCAHGHYTINLAKRFPDLRFLGYDIAQSNIDKAEAWADSDGVSNVSFKRAFVEGGAIEGHDENEKPALIIAAELLEHVADPVDLMDALMSIAGDGCEMVITTPYGPWEADGYNDFYPWRAHLWHFERDDLKELWGDFEDYQIVVVPSGNSQRGELVGSYICMFKAGLPREVHIDYERKLANTVGQQTVSLIMIAKDEERNLGRCIESAIDLVDEVLVGIDNRTADNTSRVLDELADNYPEVRFEHFLIEPATDTGFDVARNTVLSKANGDWILWLDADEVLSNAKGLRKYLRNSSLAGLAISQHHFSIEPAAVIQTDLPIRVFRNNQGIKFVGRVHEHPEVKMNEGVGKAIISTDVVIAHYGYTTEQVRRARFRRNFDLMKQDRIDYPDRILGKHLWIRDVAQSLQYTREAGRPITKDLWDAARESVDLWRELVDLSPRMAADVLPYYSQLVILVGDQQSLDYEFSLRAGPGVGRLNGAQATTHSGTFYNREHVRAFFDKVEHTQIEHLGSRYL